MKEQIQVTFSREFGNQIADTLFHLAQFADNVSAISDAAEAVSKFYPPTRLLSTLSYLAEQAGELNGLRLSADWNILLETAVSVPANPSVSPTEQD